MENKRILPIISQYGEELGAIRVSERYLRGEGIVFPVISYPEAISRFSRYYSQVKQVKCKIFWSYGLPCYLKTKSKNIKLLRKMNTFIECVGG